MNREQIKNGVYVVSIDYDEIRLKADDGDIIHYSYPVRGFWRFIIPRRMVAYIVEQAVFLGMYYAMKALDE